MQEQRQPASALEFLVRFYWLFLGNVTLFFLLIFILEKRPRLFSGYDAAYAANLVLLLVLRYVDIRLLHGETGDGRPATLSDWRRHALLVLTVGLAAWGLARVLIS